MSRQQEIILLLASIFIVSMIWIGFNLYHNAVTSTISAALSEDIVEITPNFNTAAITKLKNRHYIDPLYSFFPQQANTATTASVTQPISPSPTLTLNQTVQSTQSVQVHISPSTP